MYDCIIIGAGPAGISAGIYAARASMKTIIIEKGTPGGLIAKTDEIVITNFLFFIINIAPFIVYNNKYNL